METRMCEVLEGRERDHVFPFFWQHGESEPVLREEMDRIRACGIRAVCVEARPHPDFAGPGWWHDLDIVMDEARTHGMRVWVLDDAHFPTGFANGAIRDKYPEHRKWYLMERHLDADGPLPGASFLVEAHLNPFDWMHPHEKRFGEDQLYAVVAMRLSPEGNLMAEAAVELTDRVENGTLYWDVPEGRWRVFLMIRTRDWGGDPDYLNPIDADAVRVLIDAVYEPHLARYAADFGRTFAGFFSDEPSFGNAKGFRHLEVIGYHDMVLPWSKDVPEMLENRFGASWRTLLPGLWHDLGAVTAPVRHGYMDIVSTLYGRNFCGQLGAWCEAHGVEYIGHVVEDQNAHARLGCGTGHYFRALAGQHMAGIDYIAQQVLPRLEDFRDVPRGDESDNEFFHFGLAKMGSSLGHMDPKKKGRTLCEIFGASGWGTGVRRMKWMVDHALVRGINRFVPHAFSAKDFPDFDCPPHFYARGMNPQFRMFGELMRYTGRMCHLLDGGVHVAPVAILYHADAEWAGEAMFFQKPAHVLARSGIDFDIVPADCFAADSACPMTVVDGTLRLHQETFRGLVVPACTAITADTARFVAQAAEAGVPVFFVDALPKRIADRFDDAVAQRLLVSLERCTIVTLAALPAALRAAGLSDIRLSAEAPYFRYYRYRRDAAEYWLFFNEHPYEALAVDVELPASGPAWRYDAFANRLSPLAVESSGKGCRLPIRLSPFESMLVAFDGTFGADAEAVGEVAILSEAAASLLQLEGPWHLSLAKAAPSPVFEPVGETRLCNQTAADAHPGFSGILRYESAFDLETVGARTVLDLGEVYDAAEVWLNDQPLGCRICPPYRFDATAAVRSGQNTLRVEVVNTLVHALRDGMSARMALDPSGLLGPVRLV